MSLRSSSYGQNNLEINMSNIGENEALLRSSKEFQKLGEGKKRRRLLRESRIKDGTLSLTPEQIKKQEKSKEIKENFIQEKFEYRYPSKSSKERRLIFLEKYIPRSEGISDEEYTRDIIQFEADTSEKKEIILEAKRNDPNKKLTKEEIKIIFHPLLISVEQKNTVIAWLRKKGKYNQGFSGNPLDLSEELYSLWIEENNFYLIARYFSNTPKYSSYLYQPSRKKGIDIKRGPRGGRYTEDKTKEGRPYRRYF